MSGYVDRPDTHTVLGNHEERLRALEFTPLIVVLPDDALDAKVDTSSSGDTTLVTAPGVGIRIKVIGATLIAGGSVSVKFKSGATDKTGAMPLIASTGFASIAFICGANQALLINLSGAIQVSGVVNYMLI